MLARGKGKTSLLPKDRLSSNVFGEQLAKKEKKLSGEGEYRCIALCTERVDGLSSDCRERATSTAARPKKKKKKKEKEKINRESLGVTSTFHDCG